MTQENIPPDLEEKIKRLKVIRESSIGDEELLKRAIKRIEDNGIRVFTAKSKDDAIEIILREVGRERLVVKSKSNVTRENEFLFLLILNDFFFIQPPKYAILSS